MSLAGLEGDFTALYRIGEVNQNPVTIVRRGGEMSLVPVCLDSGEWFPSVFWQG